MDPEQNETAAAPARPGRRYPTTATGQREAARRERHKAYDARNEVLAILARVFKDSHLMPVSGPLSDLTRRRTLCIHPDDGGPPLAWVLADDELDMFSTLPELETSHYDGCRQAERTTRIGDLVRRLRERGQPGTPATAPAATPAPTTDDRSMHLLRLAIRAGRETRRD